MLHIYYISTYINNYKVYNREMVKIRLILQFIFLFLFLEIFDLYIL